MKINRLLLIAAMAAAVTVTGCSAKKETGKNETEAKQTTEAAKQETAAETAAEAGTETAAETAAEAAAETVTEAGTASVAEESTRTAVQAGTYQQIGMQEAKDIMDSEEGYIIMDARSQDEFDQGHIPGAIVLPHTEVREKAEELLPNKDQKILVYCRSGNRSKQASQVLVELGYTNVIEFGGINSWPYETEK